MTGREERPYFPAGCPITLAGFVAGGVVTLLALWVLIADGLRLL
jgi:hypothetical protein